MSLAEALSLIDSLEREVASFRKYFREPHNLGGVSNVMVSRSR